MEDPTRTIESVVKLVEATAQLARQPNANFWWRGHADSDWTLVPGIFREDRSSKYEKNVTKRFLEMAPARHDKCPRENDRVGWLSLMQHYRLPTRLLDWTESPLAAAFFAVSEPEELKKSGTIWALNPFALNNHFWNESVLLNPYSHVPQMFNPPFSEESAGSDQVAAFSACQVDLRLLAQLAAFTIHGTKQPLEQSEAAKKFLVKFQVPAERKTEIYDQLYRLGVRRSSLFPDLENLARELKGMKFE